MTACFIKFLPRVAVVLLVAAGALAEAQTDLESRLMKCAAISDSLERLRCYDALAQGATAGAGAAPGGAISAPTSAATPRPAPASGRCQATTKKGTRCSRAAKAGSSYCWQHGG